MQPTVQRTALTTVQLHSVPPLPNVCTGGQLKPERWRAKPPKLAPSLAPGYPPAHMVLQLLTASNRPSVSTTALMSVSPAHILLA